MVDALVEHLGHPECPERFFSKTKFDETATIEIIQSNIENALPSAELANYKKHITILDTKESEYVLLNQDYLNTIGLSNKQNTQFPLGTDADYKHQSVRLRVKWSLKNNNYSTASTAVSSNNTTIYNKYDLHNDQQTFRYQETQHSASYTSTQQNIDLIQSNEQIHSIKQTLQQLDTSGNMLHSTKELDLSDDSLTLLNNIIHQQPVSDSNDRLNFDQYLNFSLNENNQSDISNCLSKTSSLDPSFWNVESNNELAQFSGTANLLNNLLNSPCASNNDTYLSSNTTKREVINTNKDSQKPTGSKRKKKKTENIVTIPLTTRSIQILLDLSCIHLENPYDKYHRLQFLSNRDPVKACSKSGRSIVYFQGDKQGVVNKRQSTLPKLCIPYNYQKMIDAGTRVIMCVTCVKEYPVGETGEIGFCIVGNKKFLECVNTGHEKQVEQVCITLTRENTNDGKHELEFAIMKVPHEIANEIGPALFKLSGQYVQTARLFRFEFGHGDPLHRLAVFMLKPDSETDKSAPDWETVCLSDYIHQDKQEQPASQ